MQDKLRVGIIGLGAIGNVHANAFAAIGAEVAGICDIDESRVAATGDRLNVKGRFSRIQDLLESDVDAVVVAVGNALHREVAVAALKAGKHVLLEKPMAMNAVEAAEIVQAAKKARKVLQIGMKWRQNPAPKLVREYVEAGFFGQIYHIRAILIRRRGIPGLGGWFTTKAASGGGPMIDIGVHWFDAAMWMSGLWKPTSVSAKTYAKFGPDMKRYRYVGMWAGPPKFDGVFDVEDYSAGFVRFGKQATMTFEICWAANANEDTYVDILGDKAGVRAMDAKPLQFLTEHGNRPADICPQYDANVNGFESQAKTFVAACRSEAPPAATGEQGVVVMKLIDAVYRSSRENREVAIQA